MTKYGKGYEVERAKFKAECAARRAPCWICNDTKGPIDYTSRYAPGTRQPLLFNLDHAVPVSIGGESVRRANFRPAHYLRLQREPRQHHSRAVPDESAVVIRTCE